MRYKLTQIKELAEQWFRRPVKNVIPFCGNPLKQPVLRGVSGDLTSEFLITDLYVNAIATKSSSPLFIGFAVEDVKTSIFSLIPNGEGHASAGEFVTNLSDIFVFANKYYAASDDGSKKGSFYPNIFINGYEIIF